MKFNVRSLNKSTRIAQFRGVGRRQDEMGKPELRNGEKIRDVEGRKKK